MVGLWHFKNKQKCPTCFFNITYGLWGPNTRVIVETCEALRSDFPPARMKPLQWSRCAELQVTPLHKGLDLLGLFLKLDTCATTFLLCTSPVSGCGGAHSNDRCTNRKRVRACWEIGKMLRKKMREYSAWSGLEGGREGGWWQKWSTESRVWSHRKAAVSSCRRRKPTRREEAAEQKLTETPSDFPSDLAQRERDGLRGFHIEKGRNLDW